MPELCFIDKRKFNDYSSLLRYLENMTEEEYEIRIKAIECYLQSEDFQRHSAGNFAKTILDVVTGLGASPRSRNRALSSLISLIFTVAINQIGRKINAISLRIGKNMF